MSDSSCSCVLGGGAWGESGWHFYRIDAPDHCWNRGRTEWHVEKNGEMLERCSCTAERRRKHRDGSVEVVSERQPNCAYKGLAVAYERCPSYYREPQEIKRKDGTVEHVSFSPRPQSEPKWWRLRRTTREQMLEDHLT